MKSATLNATEPKIHIDNGEGPCVHHHCAPSFKFQPEIFVPVIYRLIDWCRDNDCPSEIVRNIVTSTDFENLKLANLRLLTALALNVTSETK